MPSPIDRVNEVPLPAGSVVVWWLGQAGFIVRGGETTFLVDPFLSPHEGRLYESALTGATAEGIDVVLCTHEHIDHFDAASAPAIAVASPDAVFVVPTPIVDMVTETGIAPDRVVGMQPGDTKELGDLAVRAVSAKHGVTMEDAYGFGQALSGGLVRFLGYVIDAGGVRIYHAGDTIHYEGMESALRHLRVDVAMLPVNGRDPEREARGIVGNLTEREAAWLGSEIEAGVIVPMHYDMFERNRGYPGHLVESVERDHLGVGVFVPARDVPFVWSSGDGR
jgi:L-ascorbate metabolism protein UlaG (beta-lactamase superfamily)